MSNVLCVRSLLNDINADDSIEQTGKEQIVYGVYAAILTDLLDVEGTYVTKDLDPEDTLCQANQLTDTYFGQRKT